VVGLKSSKGRDDLVKDTISDQMQHNPQRLLSIEGLQRPLKILVFSNKSYTQLLRRRTGCLTQGRRGHLSTAHSSESDPDRPRAFGSADPSESRLPTQGDAVVLGVGGEDLGGVQLKDPSIMRSSDVDYLSVRNKNVGWMDLAAPNALPAP
jgi:hypothetical protein